MFKKKKCQRCRNKTDEKYSFCPNCGNRFDFEDNEEWGMIGKNDFTEENLTPSFFEGGVLGKMLGSAMKMLEKEMQKNMKNMDSPNPNFKLMINGKEIPLNKKSKNPVKTKEKETVKLPLFSEEKRKEFQKLIREEPKTNLKRFPNKIVYEIEMPGVKSLENISVLKLENSIEIKAIGKKAYYKIIRVSLPIISCFFEKNRLILELGIKD